MITFIKPEDVLVFFESAAERSPVALEFIETIDEDVTLYGVFSQKSDALIFFFKNEDGSNLYCCKKPYRCDLKWHDEDEVKYWARVFLDDPYFRSPGDASWSHTKTMDTATRADGRKYTFNYEPCSKPAGELKKVGYWKIRDINKAVVFTDVYYQVDDQLYKHRNYDPSSQVEAWFLFKKEEEPNECRPMRIMRDVNLPSYRKDDLIKGSLSTKNIGYIKAPGNVDHLTLALMLQMSLENGVDFLGHPVNMADTLLVETDVDNRHAYRMLGKIAEYYDLETPIYPTILNMSTYDKDDIFEEVCDRIEYECVKDPLIKLVCIDSFAGLGLKPGNEVRKALLKLTGLAMSRDITILYTLSDPAVMESEADEGHDIKSGSSFIIKPRKSNSYDIEYYDNSFNHFELKCQKDASTHDCYRVKR